METAAAEVGTSNAMMSRSLRDSAAEMGLATRPPVILGILAETKQKSRPNKLRTAIELLET
jgi:hypothetical protein